MARAPRTLAEFAFEGLRRSGVGQIKAAVQGAQVVADIWALAFAAHQLGHWPTQPEYAAFWKITDRTAQRQWARFRQAFPDESSPDRLARWMVSELGRRMADRDSVRDAQSLRPPDLVVA